MIHTRFDGLALVDRAEYIREICRDKRVLHLGATDAPLTALAIREGRFLHSRLKEVSAHLVGMDSSQAMIDFLRAKHGIDDILFADITVSADYPNDNFEVVVAGEIIEHLDNPGLALDALRTTMGRNVTLVVTVPNAYSIKGFLRAVVGHELIHEDHVAHHSLQTLRRMLELHGFAVERAFGYVNGGAGWLAALTNHTLKVFPQLAEGVGVVCRTVDCAEAPT